MTLYNKLTSIKGKYHKCMVENVTMLLTGLLTSKTTNLNKMKDDMARVSTVKNLKSGSYYQRLLRFFDRYSATRLFLDLLMWVLQTLISEVDNFFWTGQNGKLAVSNCMS